MPPTSAHLEPGDEKTKQEIMHKDGDSNMEKRFTGNTNQSSDQLEFIDLSNIQNISDLN